MSAASLEISRNNIIALVLSASMILFMFAWQGSYGFNLGDEGFLWYGVQRVMLGEVPVRDFLAYDPGRYYWSAAFMSLWADNGIISLRAATSIFQFFGLFVGLVLVARSTNRPSFIYLLLTAVTLALWMYPRHKLFDISVSLALVGALAYYVEQPTVKRCFIMGLCVGLAAVFGRNHGIYGAVASFGAMVAMQMRGGISPAGVRPLVIWAAGICIGYLPVMAMAVGISGFGAAFWESILALIEFRTTNLALPVPWPWNVPIAQLPALEAARGLLVGVLFVAILASGILGIVWVLWQSFHKRTVSPTLTAAVLLVLPYAHFAYSRADVNHLAQGIFPFLIACYAIVGQRKPAVKWVVGGLMLAVSMLVMLPMHPGWRCSVDIGCVDTTVGSDLLSVEPHIADNLSLLSRLDRQFSDVGRSIVVTPLWPGAYAVLGKKSPMWESYALFPRDADFQREEISRIEKARPGLIMVIDWPLDGREELRFSNTHPLIAEYFDQNYESISLDYAQYDSYSFYIPRQLAH